MKILSVSGLLVCHCIREDRELYGRDPGRGTCLSSQRPRSPTTLIITFHFSITIFIFPSLFRTRVYAKIQKKKSIKITKLRTNVVAADLRFAYRHISRTKKIYDEDELPLLRYCRNIGYRYAPGLIRIYAYACKNKWIQGCY